MHMRSLIFLSCLFLGVSPGHDSSEQTKTNASASTAFSLAPGLASPASSASTYQTVSFLTAADDATPQLGRIYSRAAQSNDGHRNPIIVIPGMLGSKLVDPDSKHVAWGAFRIAALKKFRGEDAHLVALPMGFREPLSELRDNKIASGILDDFEIRILGIPVEVHAYRDILSTMGVAGYRSETVASLGAVDYGKDHFTCFEFHYDWRRDCTENAANLHEFIREKTAYVQEERQKRFGTAAAPVRFDIVAHSMGGLIARYYLRYGNQSLPEGGELPELTWEGARHVEKLIVVGTPNAGSLMAMENLINGVQYSRWFPRYEPAVLGTMPSVYQLMPRPRHGSVVDSATGKPINLYDWNVWKKYGWGLMNPKQHDTLKLLLPSNSAVQRQQIAEDHLMKSLWQARQFHHAIDLAARPPEGTSISLVAGDSKMTDSRLTADATSQTLKVSQQAPGDGTVLRASALMDERQTVDREWSPRMEGPITWSNVTFLFTDHLGLTSDPGFTDNVLYELLERPR